MRETGPSRTAIGMAIQRAAHQTLDRPPVFIDPLASRIIGPRGRAVLEADRRPRSIFARVLRAVLAVRSRLAEDELRDAIEAGVRQYVILGAGLDTFGLRNQDPDLHVFEVDHPNTQAWKRRRLQEEGFTVPPNLHFASVDFTRQDLRAELGRAGLRFDAPTFFSWLGVVPYLDPPAIRATLATTARLSGASGGIVFDFIAPPPRWHVPFRVILWFRGRQVARLGEPFRAPVRPADARRWLIEAGFEHVAIHHPRDLNARYLGGRNDGLRVSPLTHIAVARGTKRTAGQDAYAS